MAQEHHRPLSDLSADALRAKAMEYRKIADRATDPTVARALRYLAERYERVAAERKGE